MPYNCILVKISDELGGCLLSPEETIVLKSNESVLTDHFQRKEKDRTLKVVKRPDFSF